MSARKKPEKAVSVLLDRLSKARGHAKNELEIDDADHTNYLHHELKSKFDGIESKLKRMTDSLSKINNWEKKVADQFCRLEHALDNKIFIDKVPEMESQVAGDLDLTHSLFEDVSSLVNHISNPNPNHHHELISSKLDGIKSKLNQVRNSHSKIKEWEMEVVDQFSLLERVFEDEIFTFKDPEMESQVHNKHPLIEEDDVKSSSIPTMDDGHNPNPKHESSLNSRFDGIESKLKRMADSLSKIKNCEEKLGKELFALEKVLYVNEIRTLLHADHDHAQQLTSIEAEIVQLKNELSTVDQNPHPNYELISKFHRIEIEMKQMKDSFSNIKNWEKKVVDQFCVLEQGMDDEIFNFRGGENRLQVDDKLTLIEEDVAKLKSLISTVDHELSSTLDGFESKKQMAADSQSQKWAQLEVEDKISESDAAVSALLSTFHCLDDSHLKMCLLSLSVFPWNAHIKKRPLIYWWIGEGLVAKAKNSTAEAAGEQVLQELLNEGFIKSTATNKSFLVYPWTRRMLIQLAQNSSTSCYGNRRVSLRRGGEGYAMNDGERVEDLLTVFNVDEQYLGIRSAWLSRLHKVEVLQMGRWQDSVSHHIEVEDYEELFKGLGSQKHLKYLSLRGISRIETLPRSIKKLVSLQILDLKACHNLEKLPQEVTELMNLTHLDVSECYLLESMPNGLERLSNLQVLKGFVAGSPTRNSCKISDLAQGLLHLRKLSIRVRDLGNEQLRSHVNFSEALRILTISWGVVSSEIPVMGLPTSLTKLDLRSVPFETVPEWLQPGNLPANLEKLYVKGGKLKLDNINPDDYSNVKVFRLKCLV